MAKKYNSCCHCCISSRLLFSHPNKIFFSNPSKHGPIPVPWCPPPGLSQSTWPAFWPGLSHCRDMVGWELPPHNPGTATPLLCGRSCFLPATRRLGVLMSMCCLELEAEQLPEAQPNELSRRTFSTPALGNLVLSYDFPPHSRAYCLLCPTI